MVHLRGGKIVAKQAVACTINVYDRRFYERKLRSSLERKLRLYDRNPSKG
jgi:hypothetical protein